MTSLLLKIQSSIVNFFSFIFVANGIMKLIIIFLMMSMDGDTNLEGKKLHALLLSQYEHSGSWYKIVKVIDIVSDFSHFRGHCFIEAFEALLSCEFV